MFLQFPKPTQTENLMTNFSVSFQTTNFELRKWFYSNVTSAANMAKLSRKEGE